MFTLIENCNAAHKVENFDTLEEARAKMQRRCEAVASRFPPSHFKNSGNFMGVHDLCAAILVFDEVFSWVIIKDDESR